MPFKCSVPLCRSNYKDDLCVSVFQFPRCEILRQEWIQAMGSEDFKIFKNSRLFCISSHTMPYICCVPKCKGNYRNGPRVSVYNFPKDPVLRKQWIDAVHRIDFEPSDSSKVCALHFEQSQIVREASAYDPRTGRTLTAPLKIPRLREGAVPTLLMPPTGTLVRTQRGWKKNQPKEGEVKEKSDESQLVKLLQVDLGTEFQNVAETLLVVKEEPAEFVDESPQLVIEKVVSTKDMSSLSSFSSSSSNSSSSSSSSSTSNISLVPENVLPFAYPDSTNMHEIPATQVTNISSPKRKTNDVEPDTVGTASDGAEAKLCRPTEPNMPSKLLPPVVTSKKSARVNPKAQKIKIDNAEKGVNDPIPDAIQDKLCSHTKLSMPSTRKRKLQAPAGASKKPAGRSTLPSMNGENVTRNIFQSLVDGSENNPLCGNRTSDRPGDLFDVFADFIADKLREMDWDDCAYALRAVLDIVYEVGKVQRGNEVHSDISIPNTSSKSSDQE